MDFDKLVEDYKSPETFEVTLPGGEVFSFKGIPTHSALVRFNQTMAVFVKSIKVTCEQEAWKPFAPITPETAYKIYTVAELSLEPKITQLDAAKLAHGAPFLFETLYDQVEQNRSVVFQKRAKELAEAGKDE
jgi:hypothetical protein